MQHPKQPNTLFSAPYTHSGVQALIQWLMDTQGIGQFDLSKRSGLSPATVYAILNKTEKMITRPPRKSTISSLATSLGAQITFDTKRRTFSLIQEFELPPTASAEIRAVLNEIGGILSARQKPLNREERDRLLRVVRALL
jgi:transcriptional regulator with XRE-family HTH domain